jgi:hypothetical protein
LDRVPDIVGPVRNRWTGPRVRPAGSAAGAPESGREGRFPERSTQASKVAIAPLSNLKRTAAVSSTQKPRTAFEAIARTPRSRPRARAYRQSRGDQMDQNRSAAGRAPLRAFVEIVVRLVKELHAAKRDKASKCTAAHNLDGPCAMRAMRADQHRHAQLLGRDTEPLGVINQGASGFSTSAGSPAAMQASRCSTCSAFGLATITPSHMWRASNSSNVRSHRVFALAASSIAEGAGSMTAASVQSSLALIRRISGRRSSRRRSRRCPAGGASVKSRTGPARAATAH